jgi:hypothetical protein
LVCERQHKSLPQLGAYNPSNPFLVLIIDSAFYDIDLRLLSSALDKTGRRISLSQLF